MAPFTLHSSGLYDARESIVFGVWDPRTARNPKTDSGVSYRQVMESKGTIQLLGLQEITYKKISSFYLSPKKFLNSALSQY